MFSAWFKKYIDQCSDQSFPAEFLEYQFPYPIYFGSRSIRWGSGTAFLIVSVSGRSLGRLYKITEELFERINQLEGSKYSNLISSVVLRMDLSGRCANIVVSTGHKKEALKALKSPLNPRKAA